MPLASWKTGGVQQDKSAAEGGFVSWKTDKPAPSQQPQQVELPGEKLPFMAEKFDLNGLPYYGQGLKGFARKMFGKIYDPDKLMEANRGNITPELLESVTAEKFEEQKGDPFKSMFGRMFGITGEEFAQAEAAKSLGAAEWKEGADGKKEMTGETDTGKWIAQAVGLTARRSTSAFWGVMEALSVTDRISRKAVTFASAMDAVADTSWLPDTTEEEILATFEGTPWERPASLIMNLGDIAPPMVLYNALRLATSGKKLTQIGTEIDELMQGSQMIYTMMYDEGKKEEYLRRLRAGDDPDLIVAEISNPWVEVGGSILGDPTTYLGAGLPAKLGKGLKQAKFLGVIKLPWDVAATKLPTLGSLVGLKVGMTGRHANAADLFIKELPEIETALKALGEVGEQADAFHAIKGLVVKSKEVAEKYAKTHNFFSHNAAGKADVTKNVVGTVLNMLLGEGSIDEALEGLQAYRNILRGDEKAAVAGASMLYQKFGTVPFSEAGMRTMAYMDELSESLDVVALASKYGDDVEGFSNAVFDKMWKVIDNHFPDVNQMVEASKKVKQLGSLADEKTRALAEKLKDVPKIIQRSETIRNSTLMRGLDAFFANTLMGMSPGYAMRNMQSDFSLITHDLGLAAGLEAGGKSLRAIWSTSAKEQEMLAKQLAKQAKMLGGKTAYTAKKGVGMAGEVMGASKNWFLKKAAASEKMSSAVVTTYMVEREMLKALKGGIPNVKKYIPEISDDMEKVLIDAMLENWGDGDKAVSALLEKAKIGQHDSWRYLEPDPTLKDVLVKNGLWDTLDEARKTAADQTEFQKKADEIMEIMQSMAKEAANDPTLLPDTHPLAESYAELHEAFNDFVSPEDWNTFNARVAARGKVREEFKAVFEQIKLRLVSGLPAKEVDELSTELSAIEAHVESLNRGLRAFVTRARKVSMDARYKKAPIEELWKALDGIPLSNVGDNMSIARISQMFPDVDPKTLTTQQFQNMLWKFTKQTQANEWANYTDQFVTMSQDALFGWAEQKGVDWQRIVDEVSNGGKHPGIERLQRATELAQQWDFYDEETAKMVERGMSRLDTSRLGGKTTNQARASEILERLQKTKDPTDVADMLEEIKATEQALAKKTDQDIVKDLLEELGVEVPEGAAEEDMFDMLLEEAKAAGEDGFGAFQKAKGRRDEAIKAINEAKGTGKPPAVYAEGTLPTRAQQMYQNLQGGLGEVYNGYVQRVINEWGNATPVTSIPKETQLRLKTWAMEMNKHTNVARARAMAVADATRNFIMHDYNKTYADGMASMFLMYHYWPSRTYAKHFERLVDNPRWWKAYMSYKGAMEKINADQPDYYRQGVTIKGLPGAMFENPLFFNLEKTINPIQGLTQVDFNDPKRRVDWLSMALDDATKMGFNVGVPVQWAMALRLFSKGEEDAGRRWAGRLIPQTRAMKSAIQLAEQNFGIDVTPDISVLPGVKYGELDPFVNILSRGVDPYEEGKVGRQMAAMIMRGEIEAADALDQLYEQRGAAYDDAVRAMAMGKALPTLMGWTLGVGWKARTEQDMKVDQFYDQWHQLLSQREFISPDDFRKQMANLRGQYEFADAVLLAKKGGDDRDAAYTYNVLGRLPPGDMYGAMEAAGVPADMVRKFYEDKGKLSTWDIKDKERFMSAIRELAIMYELPDEATRNEWDAAKSQYNAVYNDIKQRYGDDVWDKVSVFYDLLDEDNEAANDYKQEFPEVAAALQEKSDAIMNNPEIFRYYGSFDKLEGYWDGWVRNELEKKFGSTAGKWGEYYVLKVEVEAGNQPKSVLNKFRSENPELFGEYQKYKKALEAKAEQEFLAMAAKLPSQPAPELRGDFKPTNDLQRAILEQQAGQGRMPSVSQIEKLLDNPTLFSALRNNLEQNQPIPKAARSQIEYIAKTNGLTYEDLLKQARVAFLRGE